jgi:leucyl aminopeptidase (aminopeptidase T)
MNLADAKKLSGATKLVRMCADVKPHEKVLVLTDTETLRVGELVATAAFQATTDTALAVIAPRREHGAEPPAHIAPAMAAADVVLMPLKFSMTYATACKTAREAGARVLTLGDFNARMLQEGGIEADFAQLADVVRQVAAALDRGQTAEITTPAGTRLTMDISGRKGYAQTGMAHRPGSIAGPPNVESNVGPLEGSADGICVVDGSIPHPALRVIAEPIQLTVEKGLIRKIEGGRQAEVLEDMLKGMNDPNMYNVAELGIGLNPCSSITGNMMEDEGAYGNCHIGIGDNSAFGGSVKAKSHIDLVMRTPTIFIDGVTFQENGELKTIKMINR